MRGARPRARAPARSRAFESRSPPRAARVSQEDGRASNQAIFGSRRSCADGVRLVMTFEGGTRPRPRAPSGRCEVIKMNPDTTSRPPPSSARERARGAVSSRRTAVGARPPRRSRRPRRGRSGPDFPTTRRFRLAGERHVFLDRFEGRAHTPVSRADGEPDAGLRRARAASSRCAPAFSVLTPRSRCRGRCHIPTLAQERRSDGAGSSALLSTRLAGSCSRPPRRTW